MAHCFRPELMTAGLEERTSMSYRKRHLSGVNSCVEEPHEVAESDTTCMQSETTSSAAHERGH